jgi:hypothetical protein
MAQSLVPSTVSETIAPSNDDGLDGVGPFLKSINNFDRIWSSEHSVPMKDLGPSPSKNQQKKALKEQNDEVRLRVGAEIGSMYAEGSIGPGEVKDTYQSGHDKGNDFGGERKLDGVWGDQYVLHGHFNPDGTTKSGSVGVKNSDDKLGMRIAHGVDDKLGGKPEELLQHWTS